MPRKTIYFALFFLLVYLFSPLPALAIQIPSSNRINWDPGIPGGIPIYSNSISVTDFGANGSDSRDDTQAFKDAISAAPKNTTIHIPTGTYYLSSTITLGKNYITLKGEGHQNTRLIFTQWTDKLIQFNSQWGCSDSRYVDITQNVLKNSSTITVTSASQFQVGDFVRIRQDLDPALYTCGYKGCESWQDRSMGQVLQVASVNGNQVTFTHPLNLNLKTSLRPKACDNPMVTYTGIQDLYIEFPNSTGYGSNLQMHDTAYCWVKNVWSQKSLTAHIFFDTSYGNEIRGNYFNSSYDHGAGGKGYGIRGEQQSTNNLIEDNIFNHLRHSIVFSLGSSGNVAGYNFSRNPFTSQSPNWLTSDATSHGSYATQNLFEGNIIQLALADNVWGTNGPTTFFRNRIEKDLSNIDASISNPEKFAYIEIKENNPNNNVIGNELGIPGSIANSPLIFHSSISSTTTESCNYDYQRSQFWGSTDCNILTSLYYSSKPAFLTNYNWPPLGGDISPNQNTIPARARYDNGTYIPSPDPSAPPTPPTSTPKPTSTPTSTPKPTATPSPGCAFDINRDGIVNGQDVSVILSFWRQTCTSGQAACKADLNHSGQVETGDIASVLYEWGVICQ